MAAQSNNLVKFTDNTLQVTVKDEAGNLVDFGTVNGAVAEVSQKGIEVQLFSLNTQPGHKDIEVVGPGVINLHIDKENTCHLEAGKPYYYEVKLQVANPNFQGGTQEKSTGRVLVGDVVDTTIEDTQY